MGEGQFSGVEERCDVAADPSARRERLGDEALAAEIELYGELVVAASESQRELSQTEIDRLLGVDAPR